MNVMRLADTAPSLRHFSIAAPRTRQWPAPSHALVEICTENVEGVRLSARAGADRAELCDNLAAGGTTPSIGAVESAIAAAAEEIEHRRALTGPHWAKRPDTRPFGLQVMIRPRGGSFVFDADERHAMIADVRRVAAVARDMSEYTRPVPVAGAAQPHPPAVDIGFVVGALTEEHLLDRALLRLLVATADGARVTVNKAIDATRDLVEAYGNLGALGVDAILTSGGATTALAGAEMLRGLVRTPGGPRVIASGGITVESMEEVLAQTGAREIHVRCSRADSAPDAPQRTDAQMVRRAVEIAHSYRYEGTAG